MSSRAVQQTAIGPIVIAATEQYEPRQRRIVDDPIAIRMLPRSLGRVVGALRVPWLRRLMITATERSTPGSWGSFLARKRYADDAVLAALRAGIEQVVVLGAGFDTRALRLVVPRGAVAYEVDLPDNSAAKKERVTAISSSVSDGLRLVGVDFETTDLLDALTDAGLDRDRPVMIVWEGVTQYLTEAAVRASLQATADLAPGSRLIMTYVLKDFLQGKDFHTAGALYRRFVIKNPIWTFGLTPEAVAPLLAEYGWSVGEDVGADDYRERYFELAGRDLTAMAIERFVAAERAARTRRT